MIGANEWKAKGECKDCRGLWYEKPIISGVTRKRALYVGARGSPLHTPIHPYPLLPKPPTQRHAASHRSGIHPKP